MTALVRRMRSVRCAAAASTTAGAETAIWTVVLADAEDVEADLVGELGFGNDVAEDVGVRVRAAVGGEGDVAEGVEAQLDD